MKPFSYQENSKGRKIHILLPETIHQSLRIKCAVEDQTILNFVTALITEAVKDIKVVNRNRTKLKEN
jgi:hypothetical protein